MSLAGYNLEYKVGTSGAFVGHVREFPSIIVQAPTLEKLVEEATKGIKEHLVLYPTENENRVIQIPAPAPQILA